MAIVELVIPKMGESISEATIITWLKNVGDPIEEDETVLEIATDKVDTDVPSPVNGILHKILAQPNDVVPVGQAIALIETDQASAPSNPNTPVIEQHAAPQPEPEVQVEQQIGTIVPAPAPAAVLKTQSLKTNRFYTPLVKTIAKQEGVSIAELENIQGTGVKSRVTKEDVFRYVNQRVAQSTRTISHPALLKNAETPITAVPKRNTVESSPQNIATKSKPNPAKASSVPDPVQSLGQADRVVELDRMRQLIAKHMTASINTSAHATSFLEADVTKMVLWRNKAKGAYQQKYGERLTFSPLFAEAVINAIKDFPTINASLDESGTKLHVKKDINLGIATALPSGNLIVPVIQQAGRLNLLGLTEKLNDLSQRARDNKLRPHEIQGGTFTISNIGTFGNLLGTPIINQPQLAILAIGAITKKPVIMDTDHGDIIAIRHMMFLSLSFDHRVIDGFLGGSFLKRIAENIENFDSNREI